MKFKENMEYEGFNYIKRNLNFSELSNSRFKFISITGWGIEDFDYIGRIVMGLSNSGKEKIKWNKELTLPKNNLLGQSVTGVGKDAFRNFGIRKLIIPELDEGVEYTIGTCAFYGNNIKTVNLPKGITVIESNAFQKNSIEKVKIPESIYKIGNSAFRANKISDLSFEENLIPIHIDNFAFADNRIESVRFPRNVMKTLAYVFMNNIGSGDITDESSYGRVNIYTSNPVHLKEDQYIRQSKYQKIVLIEPLKWELEDFIVKETEIKGFSKLGIKKFSNNKEVVLPEKNADGEKITSIGEAAFKNSDKNIVFNSDFVYVPNGIYKIIIPDSVKKIGKDAFKYNNINELKLPDNIEKIGVTAFAGNKIKKLELPNSLLYIEKGAFSLNMLKEITIPGNIKRVSDGAFGRNTELTKINIEEGVEKIGDYSFVGAPIRELILPSSVNEIGERAFAYHRLEYLEIPGTVKHIKNSAFRGNPKSQKLKKLVLNEGVKRISKWAFKDNLIEEIDLPLSIKLFHDSVFADNRNSDRLSRVKIHTNDERMKAFESKFQEVLIIEAGKS